MTAVTTTTAIDRGRCAERLRREIALLSHPPYTASAQGITRYAFSDAYQRTLAHLRASLEALDFDVRLDPVGNLVARNCPGAVLAVGLGSHCDSVRGGGRYDGILGVLAAVEVAREAQAAGLRLPLQIVSWVEEEAAGFGQMLLGSRIAAGQITEAALRRDIRAIDDDRPFWEHAQQAGLAIEQLSQTPEVLDGMGAWLELHIEQGRVLEDAGDELGIVTDIAGYVHADLWFSGQADHAGATPMPLRRDALVAAALTIAELECLARRAPGHAVGTVGELSLAPGIINAVPGQVRVSLDVRASRQDVIDAILAGARAVAERAATERGLEIRYEQRQRLSPIALDSAVCTALERAAASTGARWRRMVSGAAHDTMCVAPSVPSAMVFIPCAGGISHAPAEAASPADAALGVEVMLAAARELTEVLARGRG